MQPPTPETEGLRDLLRCRDDLRCARTAARHRVAKQLLRHGRVYREGKKAWTQRHRAWVARQRLDDSLAQLALEQQLDPPRRHRSPARRARCAPRTRSPATTRWAWQVERLIAFRGISTLTALGLIAEIGDFARFGHPRELASWLGITPSEYSSGDQQHRGHITKAGNRHARRLLVEARLALPPPTPRRPQTTARSPPSAPGTPRSACTTATATSPSTASAAPSTNVAIARELAGFLWAADCTDQPHRQEAAAA